MYGTVSHQPPGPVKMRNPLGWWWHTPHDLIDKIDEDFLVRDTRVVVATLARLLNDPILPLDHAAHASALIEELTAIAGKLERGFAIESLLEAAESLRDKARAVAALEGVNEPARLDRINAALMRVSRALMPLDYTEGDRFTHDPALPQPAWPVAAEAPRPRRRETGLGRGSLSRRRGGTREEPRAARRCVRPRGRSTRPWRDRRSGYRHSRGAGASLEASLLAKRCEGVTHPPLRARA